MITTWYKHGLFDFEAYLIEQNVKPDRSSLQQMKKAIISDLIKLGREAGLKSFEQVSVPALEKHLVKKKRA